MNNKGFTLIEVLAVIIVLAIIAVIAVATIVGLIEHSRERTFATSINGIREAIETNAAGEDFLRNVDFVYEEGDLFRIDGADRVQVNMTGTIAGSGRGNIDSHGDIWLAVSDSRRCGIYRGTKQLHICPGILGQRCVDLLNLDIPAGGSFQCPNP